MSKFLARTLSLALLSTALLYIIFQFFFTEYLNVTLVAVPGFFVVFNYFTYKYVTKLVELPLQKFANKYLILISLKLLIAIILVATFLYFLRSKAVPFLITVLYFYLIFLIHEVYEINRITRNKKVDLAKTSTPKNP